MSELFVSREQASSDLLSAAAYIGERIRSSDGHAEVMKAVVPLYLEKGDVDLAAELSNNVHDPFSRDRLLIQVAEKCAELDDVEYATQLADAIEDHGMQGEALERVALVLAAKGESSRADEIAQMTPHPDYVHAAIAVHEASAGRMDAAAAYLARIDFPAASVSALEQIAALEMADGRADSAVQYLDQASEAAAQIEHDEEKIRTLCEIASSYVGARRNDRAVTTYDTAAKLADSLDNMHRDAFLATCAVGFLHAGSEEMSENTLDLITDKTHMTSALTNIAQFQWDRDDKGGAVETVEEAYAIIRSQREIETRDSRSRHHAYAAIAAHFGAFGEYERAIEVAQENPDPDKQVAALTRIAEIAVTTGQRQFADQAIAAQHDDAHRAATHVALADVLEAIGEREGAVTSLDEAYSLTETVPQLSLKADLLSGVTERFFQYGREGQARQALMNGLEAIAMIRDESNQAVLLANYSAMLTGQVFELTESERQVVDTILQRT
jgi:tetratricopeptide (TPR) repeat protein